EFKPSLYACTSTWGPVVSYYQYSLILAQQRQIYPAIVLGCIEY
ncbi:MAG: hypothetical protein ACJAR8_001760, partial [Bacteroidia bacterium]